MTHIEHNHSEITRSGECFFPFCFFILFLVEPSLDLSQIKFNTKLKIYSRNKDYIGRRGFRLEYDKIQDLIEEWI